MSNNYTPTVTAGTDTNWVRPNEIVITIPINKTSPLTFFAQLNVVEEKAYVLGASDGSVVTEPFGTLADVISDLTSTWNLLDANGNVTGTMTDQQLSLILHSKYVSMAQARDANGPATV